MTKRVLDVGNCCPDYVSIQRFLNEHFDCELVQAHGLKDTLAALSQGEFALVTVNRKLDQDYSDGIEIIKAIKAEGQLSEIPVMLVTNLAEHQEAAMAIGAERGFGKLELNRETAERLAPIFG